MSYKATEGNLDGLIEFVEIHGVIHCCFPQILLHILKVYKSNKRKRLCLLLPLSFHHVAIKESMCYKLSSEPHSMCRM